MIKRTVNMKRNLLFILKSISLASIIRVMTRYLFDYTLINTYPVFIIYIAILSIINIFIIPLLQIEVTVKNKFFCQILRLLIVVIIGLLIRPIFICLDSYLISDESFYTSESFIFTFNSCVDFIYYMVISILPFELTNQFNF